MLCIRSEHTVTFSRIRTFFLCFLFFWPWGVHWHATLLSYLICWVSMHLRIYFSFYAHASRLYICVEVVYVSLLSGISNSVSIFSFFKPNFSTTLVVSNLHFHYPVTVYYFKLFFSFLQTAFFATPLTRSRGAVFSVLPQYHSFYSRISNHDEK